MKAHRDFDVDSWAALVTVIVCGLVILFAVALGIFRLFWPE